MTTPITLNDPNASTASASRPDRAAKPDQRAEEPSQKEARISPAEQKQSAIQAIDSIGGRLAFAGRVAEFSFDNDANRVVVRVYSDVREPREVVRQIPPEEFLSFVTRFRELVGVLIDDLI